MRIMARKSANHSWKKAAQISLLLALGLAACAQIIGADEPHLNATQGSGAGSNQGGASSSSTNVGGNPSTSSAGGNPSTSSGGGQGGAATTTSTAAGSTCNDQIKNGDETDVDCGGSCPVKCVIQQTCSMDLDCATQCCMVATVGQVCCLLGIDSACGVDDCYDGCQGANEDAVDCGNACDN